MSAFGPPPTRRGCVEQGGGHLGHCRDRRWWEMALARTYAIALAGVQGHVVEIEADIENGLVGLLLVGLPDTALREGRDRIRAAVVNSGQSWPQRRITVGLSPASLPK